MNQKSDILDAWITIEQLTEGNLDTKKPLKILPNESIDYKKYFLDLMKSYKMKNKSSFKSKPGFIFYFGIFEFQKVVDLLKYKYQIKEEYTEITRAKKFTLALYFDESLEIMIDQLFYTMSGYLYKYLDFPNDLAKYEIQMKDLYDVEFKEDFNQAFRQCLEGYSSKGEDFRFELVENIEASQLNLHSFFIEDLKAAKEVSTETLERYLSGFQGSVYNLDSHSQSENFNSEIFSQILRPRLYPNGRFLENPAYALSFMQQVAVNIVLNDTNTIQSVNGPPGTGKTTLLKGIFADLVVKQAKEITSLSNKEIERNVVYFKSGKIGALPDQISKHNMIVASSNNGAVQNIVNELPKIEQDVEDCEYKNLIEKTIQADYFKDIANENGQENWGLFSLEGGAQKNVRQILKNLKSIFEELKGYSSKPYVYKEFDSLYAEIENKKKQIQQYSEEIHVLADLQKKYKIKSKKLHQQLLNYRNTCELDVLEKESIAVQKNIDDTEHELKDLDELAEHAHRNFEVVKEGRPKFLLLAKIFTPSKVKFYLNKLNEANEYLNASIQKKYETKEQMKLYRKKQKLLEEQITTIKSTILTLQRECKEYEQHMEQKIYSQKEKMQRLAGGEKIQVLDFSLDYEELHLSNPWFAKEFRIKQTELFIKALEVRKQFLYENNKNLNAAYNIWSKQENYITQENGNQKIAMAWQWINFTIPVISTTFASFGRMFGNLKENTIGNLFIDEAGQALPQASIGAIYRSKRVLVVGDPSQIKPVLTLENQILQLIGRHYKANEEFVSSDASTQSLVDRTSQFGFYKDEDEWIGVPLWVHRRSCHPMFDISNAISYNNLMVQGIHKDKAQGKSSWLHVEGKAVDKYVKEQADVLIKEIKNKIELDSSLNDEIFVISPFRNVAYKLKSELKKHGLIKSENIGTVHTFQGKEAKIVYLVLGGDSSSAAAANWAVSEPNLMNVAATRAKQEFYIIGNQKLYSSLGSEVANKTIELIDQYNKKTQKYELSPSIS